MVKIALDAMGGDHAPHSVVHGGIEAARISKGRFHIVLVGDQSILEKEVEKHFHANNLPISIQHASQVVEMYDQPAVALKQKTDSSIAVSVRLHAEKNVDAFVSAGNTGAVMAASLFGLKRISGIRRPAIGGLLPNEQGSRTLLIDAGANVDCRAEDLAQFGAMGSIYMSHVFDVEKPRVGLLSNGAEEKKGNEVTLKTHSILKASPLNFLGNVEGYDILSGRCDVVVCDGFIGNITLKVAESLHGLLKTSIKRLVHKDLIGQFGAVLMRPTFKNMKKLFDYQEYGGAPLLGVQGYTIIAHGKSTPRAIKNAVLAAYKVVSEDMNSHIKKMIAEIPHE